MASKLLIDLSSPVRAAAEKFVMRAKREGLDILIYCTLRSHAEQNALYALGRTVRGAVVTNCRAGLSLHNPDKNGKAWAFDAVPVVGGVCQWQNPTLIHMMGACGEAAGLEWAGRWMGKLRESVHFQIVSKQ